jgi:hypothetical protein
MVNPNRFYTYAYLREDRTPYYIGKGQGNRAYVKRYGTGRARRPKNLNNIILLKQNLTEEEAFKHEKYMISVFGRKDLGTGILHNRTDGGEGSYGHTPWNKGLTLPEKVKQKISISRKGIVSYRPGFKHTEETKELLRQKSLGREHNKKTCEKMSKTRMGHPTSEETRKKISNSLCKGTYLMKHISGQEMLVNNLHQFCKKNNLHQARIMDRITGKVVKPYKGWTGHILEPVL